jgi:osmotically-inducible protein OsmY
MNGGKEGLLVNREEESYYDRDLQRDYEAERGGRRGDYRERGFDRDAQYARDYGREGDYGRGEYGRDAMRDRIETRSGYGREGYQTERQTGWYGEAGNIAAERRRGQGYGREQGYSGEGQYAGDYYAGHRRDSGQFGQPSQQGEYGDYGRQGWTTGQGFQQGDVGRQSRFDDQGYASQGRQSLAGRQGEYGDYAQGGMYSEYGPSSGASFGASSSSMRGPYTGKGPRGYHRSDERIREDVCECLTQHGQIDASNIEVQVSGGEVTLGGTVDNRQMKRMAEDAVEGISGVKDVNNQIRVQQAGQWGQGQGQWNQGQWSQGQPSQGQWAQSGQSGGQTFAGGQAAQTGQMGASTTGRDWSDVSATYRQDWEKRYGQSSQRWEEVEPAYRYSYEMASNPRFQGRRWSDVEAELGTGYADWAQRQGFTKDDSAWDRLKEQVRESWDRVTGMAH